MKGGEVNVVEKRSIKWMILQSEENLTNEQIKTD